MKKFSKLIDLPIINNNNGVRLGKISDVLFDTRTLRICAFVIATNGIIPLAKIIKIDDVSKIDSTSVWVNSKDALVSTKISKDFANVVSYQNDLEGTIIIQNSHKIGTISDILFNAEIGEIAEFEVSDGFVEDVLSGRKSVTIDKDFSFKNKKIEIKNGE